MSEARTCLRCVHSASLTIVKVGDAYMVYCTRLNKFVFIDRALKCDMYVEV